MQALISQILLSVMLFAALPGRAQEIAVVERHALPTLRTDQPYALRLTLVYLEGSGWTRERIEPAVQQAATILAQCGIRLERAELVRARAPLRFHALYVPFSRALARELALEKPAVYFVADTR